MLLCRPLVGLYQSVLRNEFVLHHLAYHSFSNNQEPANVSTRE